MNPLEFARSISGYLVDVRRHLHANPELSFREQGTTDFVVAELTRMGIEVTRWDDMNGAIGLIRGDSPGPTIALRSEMDALPIQETTGAPYASKCDGVMHACGHDAHMSVLLGTARLLCEQRARLNGNCKLIFQPAEETPPGGALGLIEKGVLDNPKVDEIVALHVNVDTNAGQVAIIPGQFLAGSDHFTLTLSCRGGHGAVPSKGVDGIPIAAQIILGIHTYFTRQVDPLKRGLISFGTIHGGTKSNILANQVVMTGTCRALDPELASIYPELILRVARGIAGTFDATAELRYERGYPPTVNEARVTALLEESARRALGKENVIRDSPIMVGDDMAYFLDRVPGTYFSLGITPQSGVIAPAHTSGFDIDESALPVGVAVMVQFVMDRTGHPV